MREPGPGDIRQNDLAAELGIDFRRMKGVRAEHLCSDDWFTCGKSHRKPTMNS